MPLNDPRPLRGAALPALIAHRGASYEAPENTLAAFELAWRQGADGVEVDVHLSRDGRIVCIHDADTLRTTGKPMTVAEATFAELRRLDAGLWKGEAFRGQSIPAIEEVLATVPHDKRIFIEIKCTPAILPALKRQIDRSGLRPDQTVAICFGPEVIAETKRLLPGVKAYWLTGFKTDESTGAVNPSANRVVAQLDACGADGADCHAHPSVDRPFVQALRKAGRELHVWTVDDLPTAERMARLGVDSITSNRAAWLKGRLARRLEG